MVVGTEVYLNKRFENRELAMLQELRHPNIVALKYAFYTQEMEMTYLNLVMEYCSETIHQYYTTKNKKNNEGERE